MSIPNVIRFVWTGRSFPYYARLAIESVLLADPRSEVVVHLFGPTPQAARHFDRVLQYDRVRAEVVEFDDVFSGLDSPASRYVDLLAAIPQTAYSALSNVVRLGVLHRWGGVYLDFDILVRRPFGELLHHEAFIGEELALSVDHAIQARKFGAGLILPVAAHTAAFLTRRAASAVAGSRDPLPGVLGGLDRVWGRPELNNAVIGARPGNGWLRAALRLALTADPTVRYALGPRLMNETWAATQQAITRMGTESFYVLPPSRSFAFFECAPFELPAASVLIHYVSSNHSKLLGSLDESKVRDRRHRGLFWQMADATQRGAAELSLHASRWQDPQPVG